MITSLDYPTTDLINIAAVVTGGQRIHLVGWQRDMAIQAMHALGFNADHVATLLSMSRSHLINLSGRLGLSFFDPDTEPDPHAVGWVLQGTRLPLQGADRDQAIRELAARGRCGADIARLLCTTNSVIVARARVLNVELPRKAPVAWWQGHANQSKKPRTQVAA